MKKLTTKQKEAILLMREGGILSRFLQRGRWVGSIAPWVQLGKDWVKLTMPSLEQLIENGLVERTDRRPINPHIPEAFYSLTELGKTIDL